MIEIANVPLPLDTDFDSLDAQLLRLSVDARRKSDVHFVATLGVRAPDGVAETAYLAQLLSQGRQARLHEPYEPLAIAPAHAEERPVVVGSGPAGLFAALYLARAGLRPIVLERGAALEERIDAVAAFNAGGPLDPRANIQFGEGGAGTFSDGKLTTNIKNPLTRHVLRWFVEAGAPAEIEVLAKPHIGTDVLRRVVRRLHEQIEEAGGELRFNTQLIGLETEAVIPAEDGDTGSRRDGGRDDRCPGRDGGPAEYGRRLAGIRFADASGEGFIGTRHLILACGHSARDTFRMLLDAGLPMEQKPFSMGVRIEHRQHDIDRSQYGAFAGHAGLAAAGLAAADYKMAAHLENGRSVYTFCMCPGGQVVCAASEEGGTVVNGMSEHARDGENANSALLVSIEPADFGSDHPLAGAQLQRRIEQRAFRLARKAGGAPYQAPAQRVGSFLEGCAGHTGGAANAADTARSAANDAPDNRSAGNTAGHPEFRLQPSYARGVVWCDLHECLPGFVSESIEQALPLLDRKLHGFASPDAIMTGVETRSSSPVRIVRDSGCQSPGCRGLFPCGEGAGYAGGIMSAAVDGLRTAIALRSECGELR